MMSNYLYQILSIFLAVSISLAIGSIFLEKYLTDSNILITRKKIINFVFILGTIPISLVIISLLPFDPQIFDKILAFLPQDHIANKIATFLNGFFDYIYSPLNMKFMMAYLLCLFLLIYGDEIVEKVESKRSRFLIYTVFTLGFYPVYYLISSIYDPKVSQKLVRGTRVIRDAKKAEKTISRLLSKENCKGIKIHDKIELPFTWESQHIFYVGGSGAGKTVAIFNLVESIIKRKDRLLLYDRKGDYTQVYGEDDGVAILSPFDERGVSWDIASDIDSEILADEFSSSLISIPKEAKETQWYEAAQDLLTGVVLRLQAEKSKEWSFSDLDQILNRKEDVIESCVQYNPGALQNIGDIDDKQTSGVFMNLRVATKKIKFLAKAWKDSDRKISLIEWINDENHPHRTIILRGNSKYSGVDDFLMTQYKNMAYKEVLALPDSDTRRIFDVNDETGSQPAVKNLLKALSEGRSKGLCIVSAVQDIGQIRDKYGRDQAQSWYTNYGTIFAGRVSDPETASFLAKSFGQNKVVKTGISIAEEGNKISRSSQEHTDYALLDSDFLNLPKASLKTGTFLWLRISGLPAAQLNFKIISRPKRYESMKPMAWLTASISQKLPASKKEMKNSDNLEVEIDRYFDDILENTVRSKS